MKDLIVSCFAFISANFTYQMIQEIPDYLIASERSFFQLVIVLFILFRIRKWKPD